LSNQNVLILPQHVPVRLSQSIVLTTLKHLINIVKKKKKKEEEEVVVVVELLI